MTRALCPNCLNRVEMRKMSSAERYVFEHCGLMIIGNTPEDAKATWERRAPEFFMGRRSK